MCAAWLSVVLLLAVGCDHPDYRVRAEWSRFAERLAWCEGCEGLVVAATDAAQSEEAKQRLLRAAAACWSVRTPDGRPWPWIDSLPRRGHCHDGRVGVYLDAARQLGSETGVGWPDYRKATVLYLLSERASGASRGELDCHIRMLRAGDLRQAISLRLIQELGVRGDYSVAPSSGGTDW